MSQIIPKISAIDLGTDVLTASAAHGFSTGHAIGLRADNRPNGSAGSLPASSPQVTVDGVYFARKIDATTFTLHPTQDDADADTNAIDFSAAGIGDLYAWRLTVRERILRQLVANLRAALPGIGPANVQRFDEPNENKPIALSEGMLPEVWILLTAAGEDVDNGGETGETSAGLTTKSMSLFVDCHLLQPPIAGMTLDEYGNAWAGKIEEILKTDPQVTETASGNELVNDMLLREVSYPDPQDGNRDQVAGLALEILYDHEEADPWKGRADLDW